MGDLSLNKPVVVQYYDSCAKLGLQLMAVNKGKDKDGTTNVVDIVVPSGMSLYEFAKAIAIDGNGGKEDNKLQNGEIFASFKNYSGLAKIVNSKRGLRYGDHLTLKLDDAHLSKLSDYITNSYDPKQVLHNKPAQGDPGTITVKKGDNYTKIIKNNMKDISQSDLDYYNQLLAGPKQLLSEKKAKLNLGDEATTEDIKNAIIDAKKLMDEASGNVAKDNSQIKALLSQLKTALADHNAVQDKIDNRSKSWLGIPGLIGNIQNWFKSDKDRNERNKLYNDIKNLKEQLAAQRIDRSNQVAAYKQQKTAKSVLSQCETLSMQVDDDNTNKKPYVDNFQTLFDQANAGDKKALRKIRDIMINRMFISNAGETKDNISGLSPDALLAKFAVTFSKYNPHLIHPDDVLYTTPTVTGMNDLKFPITVEPEPVQ